MRSKLAVNPDDLTILQYSSFNDQYNFCIKIPFTDNINFMSKTMHDFREYVNWYIGQILALKGLGSSFPQKQDFDVRITVHLTDPQMQEKIFPTEKINENPNYWPNITDAILKLFNTTLISSHSQAKQSATTVKTDATDLPYFFIRFTSL